MVVVKIKFLKDLTSLVVVGSEENQSLSTWLYLDALSADKVYSTKSYLIPWCNTQIILLRLYTDINLCKLKLTDPQVA